MVVGLALRRTLYSVSPIFWVPAGMISAWLAMVLLTSMGVRPWARRASGSQIDLHLAGRAAEGIGDRHAGNGGDLRAHHLIAEVEQLRLGELVAGHGQLQDGHAGGVVLEDQRWQRAGRHVAAARSGHRP